MFNTPRSCYDFLFEVFASMYAEECLNAYTLTEVVSGSDHIRFISVERNSSSQIWTLIPKTYVFLRFNYLVKVGSL